MEKLLTKYRQTIDYLFFGILTVIFNTGLYLSLSFVLDDIIANTIAFLGTVIFAYWTNSTYVFKTRHTRKNFLSFMGMRLMTLPIDDLGLAFLLYLELSPLVSKSTMNVILIAINYVISKFVIFNIKKG